MVSYFTFYSLRGVGQLGDNPIDIQWKFFDLILVIHKETRVDPFHTRWFPLESALFHQEIYLILFFLSKETVLVSLGPTTVNKY